MAVKKGQQEVFIIDAVRTPVGKVRGVFANTRSDYLFACLIKELAKRNKKVDLGVTDDVIVGCATQEAEQAFNVGRVAALLGGLPNKVPGMSINRLCSSGLQSVAIAADAISLGNADLIIAGGLESMSMVPMIGNKQAFNPALFEDENVAIAYGMGITAEKVADKYKITREEQDEYALESHRRAIAAQDKNAFAKEIVPIKVSKRTLVDGDQRSTKGRKVHIEKSVVTKDEGPRRGSSIEVLASLRTVFAQRGSVTAATSSQVSDGAGALLVASEKFVNKHGIKPLAKFHSFAVAGVPPEIMGIGPSKAIPKVLKKSKLKLEDIGCIELNEAFAAQTLAVIKDLGLNKEIVNPLGGAIALGHPLGATGAIRSATLLHNMKKNKIRYGMTTMCVGVGMGAAGIFELV